MGGGGSHVLVHTPGLRANPIASLCPIIHCTQFVWLLISIYGISQGLGETYMSMSTDYYLKEDLKMEPAAAQAIKSLIHLPWNIKPVRAIVVDRCACLLGW